MLRFLPRSLSILTSLLIIGLLVAPVFASQGATPATADACLDEGFRNWSPDEPGTGGFNSEAECVAFVEAGGTLIPVRRINLSLIPFLGVTTLCTVEVTLTGFAPGMYEATNTSLGYAWRPYEVTIDRAGTGHYQIPYPFVPGSDSVEAIVDGLSSGPMPVACDG